MVWTFKTHSSYYIFTEFCNGGDLSTLCHARAGGHAQGNIPKTILSEEETSLVIKQVIKGLISFNENKIIHRDLKPQNIMINFKNDDFQQEQQLLMMDSAQRNLFLRNINLKNANFEVKIGDLGLSKGLDLREELSDTMCGTPLYMSP